MIPRYNISLNQRKQTDLGFFYCPGRTNNMRKKDYRQEVRKVIKESGLPHWRVAQLMDISENTLSRRFRNEMTLEDLEDIKAVIEVFKRQTA